MSSPLLPMSNFGFFNHHEVAHHLTGSVGKVARFQLTYLLNDLIKLSSIPACSRL